MSSVTRKVGERGQVTIPKDIREKENIRSGDEVEFHDEDGEVTIKKKEDLEERLKEGYKAMAEKSQRMSEEMLNASSEAIEEMDEDESK
jgi:AbrB family looped-hinge helix DNA binding protein